MKYESRQQREVCGKENARTNTPKNDERRERKGKSKIEVRRRFYAEVKRESRTGGSSLFSSQTEEKNTFDQYLPVTLTSACRRLPTIDRHSIDE